MTIAVKLFHLMLLALLLAAGPAQAQQSQPLTNSQIENFIASLKDLRSLDADFERFAPDLTKGFAAIPNLATLISDAVARMAGTPLRAELDEVVRDQGFDNATTWGKTGDRILNAYIAHQAGAQDQALRDKIAQAVKRIDDNPDMTDAQKRQMKALIGGTVAYVEAMVSAPQEDMEAVEPYLVDLNRLLAATN
ncbi:MAG: hypothetical protein KGY54_06250 [Oleiphilaceae bacterium]|nr:hypothetical protein [Oleiphilaceae bacterium]